MAPKDKGPVGIENMRELWRTVVTTSRNVMGKLRPMREKGKEQEEKVGFQMTAPKPPLAQRRIR